MNKKTFFIFLIPIILVVTLFLSTNVSASYISGNIKIYENGLATFNVETDTPVNIEGLTFTNNKLSGTTNVLTKKEGNIWTFALNFPSYENILLDIELPKSVEVITNISGVQNAINPDNKIISIADSGKLNFSVSYKIKQTTDYSWIIWITIIIVIVLVIIIYYRFKKKKERLEHIMPIINENEQKIISLLMKKRMRQKQLRETLNIPKASFTRYMLNLEKKKLIIREGEGKNKVVKLK